MIPKGSSDLRVAKSSGTRLGRLSGCPDSFDEFVRERLAFRLAVDDDDPAVEFFLAAGLFALLVFALLLTFLRSVSFLWLRLWLHFLACLRCFLVAYSSLVESLVFEELADAVSGAECGVRCLRLAALSSPNSCKESDRSF